MKFLQNYLAFIGAIISVTNVKVRKASFFWISSKHKEEWRFGAIAVSKYVIVITSKWKEFIPLKIAVVQEFGEGPLKQFMYIFHFCITLWVKGIRK